MADVGTDSGHIYDLVESVSNLPPPSRAMVLDYLESLDPSAFDTSCRDAVWAKLREQISSHRRFSHAPWAMPSEDVDRLAAVYERFTPEDPIQQAL